MIERNQQKDIRLSDILIIILIEVRNKEIKYFQRFLRDVGIFVEMCQYFSGKQIFLVIFLVNRSEVGGGGGVLSISSWNW